ncbi:MAG: aminotransferase class IV [Isosphaeraceae bacterium]|nr:aminotransferase class IV [Isosphaeraceae bacterium]
MMFVWHRGRVRNASEVQIDLSDSIFEHGLGLFETFRSWNRRVPLLHSHLARWIRSGRELGLADLQAFDVPSVDDVRKLLETLRLDDALLRLTRTGGARGREPSAWLRASPLPPAGPIAGLTLIETPWRIDRADPLARHKTLNYWSRRRAFEHAVAAGAHEGLLFDHEGSPWEGSRTNLFVVLDDRILTPTLEGPIVPGVMRAAVVDVAGALGFDVEECTLAREDLLDAREIFLTNSVRGIMPVERILGDSAWQAPGRPVTSRELAAAIDSHLGTLA